MALNDTKGTQAQLINLAISQALNTQKDTSAA